ncbi:B12-binding domain-containing radical SAM protein [Geobacter sp. AOG2]|uniref:B12-binding domain-containing radical SAM protein n=1 Tax=Geobacter sp. AOG2 TaxID=1566347 RepID=UPI001CC48129|nr:radical SAM protein [Geobacter sp. AOG2]GFE62164.1 magnesium-protoporphyrin IX monomethyl estercyclase [Geobacter sp. AOG2]
MAEVIGRWIPLNFVYLAGVARQAGLVAEIYDAAAKEHGYPEMGAYLRENGAEYVATTAITATINDAIKTLELVKDIDPNSVTILGGVHPTFMYDEVFAASPAVDYIVIGEGEATLRHLLSVLEEGGNPATVPGIAFRQNGAVIRTATRAFIDDLDDLPVAWDLLEWKEYTYFVIPNSRLGAISTSRGCDQDNGFGSQQRFWEKSWRARDPRSVVAEMEYLYKTYQVNVLLITDEHPTRDRERWETLLDLLIARELPLHLLLETRASDIIRDREIIWKYRKAGIIHIFVGFEAASQSPLDAVGRETGIAVVKQALALIHEQGIVSDVSFVLGFPEETPDSIKKTMQLVQQCNPDNANFLALTPWPYADRYEEVKPYIRQWDYSKYNLVDPVVEPRNMNLLQVDVALADCYRRFYMGKILDVMTMKDDFKRGYLLRATKLFMSSAFVIRKLGVGILGKIPAKMAELRAKRKEG